MMEKTQKANASAREVPAKSCQSCKSCPFLPAIHSARKASIGSKPAARHAGYTPEIKPTLAETISAAVTAKSGKTVGTGVSTATKIGRAHV